LKIDLDNGVLKCSYGLCSSRIWFMLLTQGNRRRKKSFWNEVFHLVSCIPQNEMVVLAGEMSGHVASSNVSYDGTRGGFA